MPGPGPGWVVVWRLLLSEWPSLVLIYSSLYTKSSGSLLIFTSTGDIRLLTLGFTPKFMIVRIVGSTVPYQLDLTNYLFVKCVYGEVGVHAWVEKHATPEQRIQFFVIYKTQCTHWQRDDVQLYQRLWLQLVF